MKCKSKRLHPSEDPMMPTSSTTGNDDNSTSDQPSPPPWQFRWKRPKWDRVELDNIMDMDVIEHDEIIANENNVTGIEIDHSEVINDKWTPISNSSVVLSRREAQTVIRELHRRNKLNTNNVPSHRGRSGDIILVERSRKYVETPPNSNNPPPSSQLFASWWKSFIPSGTSKENNNTKNNSRLLEQAGDYDVDDVNKIIIKSTTIATNRSNNNHNHNNEGKPPIISIASPLPNKPNNNNGDDTHYSNSNDDRHDHDDDNDDNLSPPSSPTSFSTFSLQPTPKKNNNMNCKMILHDTIENNNRNDGKEDWRGNEGGGGGGSSSASSPQMLSDASMASSLLWGEDMTLTTVSEDEAASYRFHQQYAGAGGGSTTASTGIGWDRIEGGSYEMDDDGQRYRSSSPAAKTANDAAGNRIVARSQRRGRNEEWGGYDHVVLSVTIFATEGAASTSSCPRMDANLDERQRSGEVVVMELLSTKDPPLSGSILPPTTTVPPPPSSRLPPRGREKYTPSIASGVVNSADNNDYDDDDTTGNHTRILYRRVLWWPSSIRSGRGVAKNRRGDAENDRDRSETGTCPSFVALGRTSIWKHMDEDQSPLNPDDEDDQNKGHDCDKKIHRKQYDPTFHDDEDRNERAADAMEAVRSLNFLFGVGGVKTSSTVAGTQKPPLYSPPKVTATNTMNTRRGKVNVANGEHSKPKDGGEKPVKIMKKITQPLSMCMVTSDGQVHFFYALRVLLGGTPKKRIGDNGESKNDMDLSSSFAALMFGSKMFARVNSNVLPLSHPHASVKLSLIDSSRVVMSDDIRDQNSNVLDRNSNDSFSQHFDHSADVKMGVSENEQDAHWSSIGLFDATIDPASIHMRTLWRSNTLTGSCITSDTNNSYLAVCGRGLRRTVHRDDNGHQHSSHILGGFVTFVSLRHYTESRTIYLPFAPASMQPVYWAGMHFVALLGEKASQEVPRRRRPFAMLVKVDCGQGEERSNIGKDMARNYTAHPARFQCLSVVFPSVKESLGSLSNLLTTRELDRMYSKAVVISSIPSSPPEILLTFQTGSSFFAVNHSLLPSQRGDPTTMVNSLSLSTVIRPGRRALLDIRAKDSKVTQSESMSDFSRVWCAGGQGWSLVGTHGAQGKSFFICWDGSVDDNQGPFIFPFHLPVLSDSSNGVCLISSVVPLMSYVKYAEKASEYSCPSISHCHFVNDRNDFSSGFIPENSFASTLNESTKLVATTEGGLDGIIMSALESISIQFPQTPENAKTLVGARMNRSKSFGLSCQEKSNRLLQQCSSWTALEDPKENRGVVNGQVIMTTVRFGSHFHSLTLRTNIVANPISTPFQTVLGWLCQQRDYYTAASVALSLLDDAEAVYELCGIPRSLEESMYHHKGLIDGIKPLFRDSALGVVSETLVSLADMAVACLIKGGSCMSTTLEGFLARNTLYSAPRASLMLVGTVAAAVSKETVPDIEQTKVHNIVEMVANAINPSDDVLWPLRCLMKMAVVRNCLHSTILMLNATIPNELRWRAPKSQGLASASRPPLGLFLSLSGMILESTPKAIRYFLQMMDEETGLPFWFSVDDDTRLALILMPIRGKRVMLQEPEVRMWALDRLHEEIKRPGTDSAYPTKDSLLQNGLLTEIVIGALCNAECFMGQGMDTIILRNVSSMTEDEDDMCYRQDMLRVRDLLVPNNGCLDFDLVIAALLILNRRGGDRWREGSQISTQILLNTACDLAGRKSEYEPKFVFDAASAMRQCALVNNLQAAAFLIGGRKGLIIECMDLLVSCLDLTVQDAELMLYANSLVELSRDVPLLHEVEQKNEEDSTIFVPSESHRHLLWLLQEHVLNIHTYGNFDDETHSSTGKITPVFAGRICFRVWYILTSPSALPSSVLWLENWLRRHLALACGKSSKRLACAALIRILLWADESDDIDLMESEELENSHLSLLATVIGLKRQFLAELAQACCGLIQSIPPHVAEELMSSCTAAGGSKFVSYKSLEKSTTVQKVSPY